MASERAGQLSQPAGGIRERGQRTSHRGRVDDAAVSISILTGHRDHRGAGSSLFGRDTGGDLPFEPLAELEYPALGIVELIAEIADRTTGRIGLISRLADIESVVCQLSFQLLGSQNGAGGRALGRRPPLVLPSKLLVRHGERRPRFHRRPFGVVPLARRRAIGTPDRVALFVPCGPGGEVGHLGFPTIGSHQPTPADLTGELDRGDARRPDPELVVLLDRPAHDGQRAPWQLLELQEPLQRRRRRHGRPQPGPGDRDRERDLESGAEHLVGELRHRNGLGG